MKEKMTSKHNIMFFFSSSFHNQKQISYFFRQTKPEESDIAVVAKFMKCSHRFGYSLQPTMNKNGQNKKEKIKIECI